MDTLLSKRYPRPMTLSDGRAVTCRPLQAADEPALLAFFRGLSVDERALLKHDVTRPEVIRAWCRKIDYDRVLPLLGLAQSRIVADVSMHRDARPTSRHVALVRITVHPEFRGTGLARALVSEVIDVAPSLGVAILDAEILPQQAGAMRLFESLGFTVAASLAQHARDLNGKFHDVVLLTNTLVPPEKLAADENERVDYYDVGGGG